MKWLETTPSTASILTDPQSSNPHLQVSHYVMMTSSAQIPLWFWDGVVLLKVRVHREESITSRALKLPTTFQDLHRRCPGDGAYPTQHMGKCCLKRGVVSLGKPRPPVTARNWPTCRVCGTLVRCSSGHTGREQSLTWIRDMGTWDTGTWDTGTCPQSQSGQPQHTHTHTERAALPHSFPAAESTL